ncbi:unnamed protein product [Nesidiocoris tenuis]|uniref:Uncharacterized protein n=1 Tax=Nesidiocoris tenuis TaxID=355587 RepID=A0A6H5G9U7_9HEMI|nr:unnamed protein product [Nesidiocoris tenuis]
MDRNSSITMAVRAWLNELIPTRNSTRNAQNLSGEANPITYNVARSGQSKTNYYNDSKQIQPAELLEFLWRRICSN